MGFSTLLDIIGATIIGGMLIVIMNRLNQRATETTMVYGDDKLLQMEVVQLADLIEGDFRRIGYCEDPSQVSDSTLLIVSADTSHIKFITDADRNGILDTLEYYVSDTSAMSMTKNPRDRILYRAQYINGQHHLLNISSDITQFYLRYFDALNYELIPPLQNTRTINYMEISFKVEDSEAYADTMYSKAYWQQVRLTSRNLRKR